jgi:S-adenosylmethionine:tRNA ribosyltransferase-isomerase
MTYVTLHIGLGTFRPVDVEDLTKHKMDSENFIVGPEAVEPVNKALDNKNRVIAIGTTTMRALESSVSAGNRLKPREGWTDKFIFPPYEFKICNAMVTNFHMPESTLLMMAAAFGGYDLIMEAYKVAKKEKYKFLTYGDAMLII